MLCWYWPGCLKATLALFDMLLPILIQWDDEENIEDRPGLCGEIVNEEEK
jgi:hypothetical protein